MRIKILLFALVATTMGSFGQTKTPVKKATATAKPVVSKFGALAIDRSNGFYYGWSFDYATVEEAETKAIEECNAKGGNCTVVLSYSGTGCAAYRTIEGEAGTAYGWGLAKTKEAADAIATKECLERSNGKNPANFVYSCNSANSGTLKEIYNATDEIPSTVKIGTQEWTNRNLNTLTFRNGDPVLLATNNIMWNEANDAQKPVCRYFEDKKDNKKSLGLLYNWYAVNDPRGLAPEGYKIPDNEDWETLINFIGDNSTLVEKLKSKNGWNELNGTDTYGFNALPGGNGGSGGFNGKGAFSGFWSSSDSTDDYVNLFPLYGHRQNFNKFDRNPRESGMSVRCLKE